MIDVACCLTTSVKDAFVEWALLSGITGMIAEIKVWRSHLCQGHGHECRFYSVMLDAITKIFRLSLVHTQCNLRGPNRIRQQKPIKPPVRAVDKQLQINETNQTRPASDFASTKIRRPPTSKLQQKLK
jgi:hypothetical protein